MRNSWLAKRRIRLRDQRLVAHACTAVKDVGANFCDTHQARRPIGRNIIGMVMGCPCHMQGIETIQRGGRNCSCARHDGRRHASLERSIARKAELTSRSSFRSSEHNAANGFRKCRVAKPIEDHLGDRLLAIIGLMSGLIRNSHGQASDGPITVFPSITYRRCYDHVGGATDLLSETNDRQYGEPKRSKQGCVTYHFSATCSG